jgi:hypothetical protein
MKKLFVPIFAFVILLASCKKDNPATPAGPLLATITATIDGASTTFDTTVTATKTNSYGFLDLLITGFHASGSSSEFSIDLTSVYPFSAGTTYTDAFTALNAASITYLIQPANISCYNPGNGTTQVHITSISSTNVQGTFSGSVSDGSTTHTITNGTFNATIH